MSETGGIAREILQDRNIIVVILENTLKPHNNADFPMPHIDKIAWLCDFSISGLYIILGKTEIGRDVERQEKNGFSLARDFVSYKVNQRSSLSHLVNIFFCPAIMTGNHCATMCNNKTSSLFCPEEY